MNRSLVLTLLLLASNAFAGRHDDRIINSGSELRDWCKDESEATFIGRGLKPYNWTASYSDEGVNGLLVKGNWRVNETQMSVVCRVARGAEERYASMSIQDSQ